MNIQITLKSISHNGKEIETTGGMSLHSAINMLRALQSMWYTAIITTESGKVVTVTNWFVLSTCEFMLTVNSK